MTNLQIMIRSQMNLKKIVNKFPIINSKIKKMRMKLKNKKIQNHKRAWTLGRKKKKKRKKWKQKKRVKKLLYKRKDRI